LQSSRVVILTGESYDTLAYKNYTLSQGGLGIFEGNYMTDAHCSEYGREARLIRVLHETRDLPFIGTTKGISIDEDHALVVTGLYTGRPIGTVWPPFIHYKMLPSTF
jgi:cyanophycinase-like exopeptidase